MALTDMAVRQARASDKPRNLLDGDGLSLFVPVKGRKAWHLRYTFAGRERRISLGTYPEVSLREARELREAARAQLAKGLNPRAERKRKHGRAHAPAQPFSDRRNCHGVHLQSRSRHPRQTEDMARKRIRPLTKPTAVRWAQPAGWMCQ